MLITIEIVAYYSRILIGLKHFLPIITIEVTAIRPMMPRLTRAVTPIIGILFIAANRLPVNKAASYFVPVLNFLFPHLPT